MVEVEPGKWVRLSRSRFRALVLQHVAANGDHPHGFLWQLMCHRVMGWDCEGGVAGRWS